MNVWPRVTQQQKKADFSTLCQLWHLKLSNKPNKEFRCQILDNSSEMILNCGHVSNTYASVLQPLNAEGDISCWSEFTCPNGNSISWMAALHFMAYENSTPCAFLCSDSCLKPKLDRTIVIHIFEECSSCLSIYTRHIFKVSSGEPLKITHKR